jgi:hypothetical protein
MPFDATPLTKGGLRLMAAADLIEQVGWCRKAGRSREGICAGIAIAQAGAIDLLPHVEAQTGWGIAAWNDAPGRTKEQVIDLLRSAAWSAP